MATTAVTLTWTTATPSAESIWGKIVHLPVDLGRSQLVHELAPTILTELGPGATYGATLVALSALAALTTSLRA